MCQELCLDLEGVKEEDASFLLHELTVQHERWTQKYVEDSQDSKR